MALKNNKANNSKKLSRKQQRKQMRKEKKIKRNEFYTKRKRPGAFVLTHEANIVNSEEKRQMNQKKLSEPKQKNENADIPSMKVPTTEEMRKKEIKEQKRIQNDMVKQRKKQLLQANIEDERLIKQMEKQLGLKKRKTKSVPKSFAEDGLDYLLEVCNPEFMKNAAAADQDINEANDEFEEDFELMTKKSEEPKNDDVQRDSDDETSDFDEEFADDSDEGVADSEDKVADSDEDVANSDEEVANSDEEVANSDEDVDDFDEENYGDRDSDAGYSEDELSENQADDFQFESEDNQMIKVTKKKENDKVSQSQEKSKKRKHTELQKKNKKQKFDKSGSEDEEGSLEKDEVADFDDDDSNCDSDEGNEDDIKKGAARTFADGTWEDIYGRKRSKDGLVITNNQVKYIPPAMREKLKGNSPEDKKRTEKLNRLKKQLKGFINRLAESNMHYISTKVEELYMNNSRNDMNDTLTSLITESIVSGVMSPERLLIEHIVLLTILHANVGTEVGAHFLQHVIRKFDEHFSKGQEVENKTLDNIVCIIAQLYNFKLFDSKLLYEVLDKFAGNFKEKDVECILHILRSVGFTLRKDDPHALKNLIVKLQSQAANVSEEERDNSRVKFMLDILLAIKNNNVTKIPNYDTSYSEHMKKVMKGFIRKGNYVTQLNISLEDLLKADERGRWWVVGSAWTGHENENVEETEKNNEIQGFSAKLLELAKKQRMNTDTRRNIFCIMMSAEDYMDAFEKLLKLGLKNQQEREIINVILHCCLQEKNYNPYYGFLAQKFCDHDRKYQMGIKYSVWDKLKAITDHSGSQISNLAKLLIHLFIEKGLPISTLKIVQFSELDKVTLRFMRQILLGILLHQDVEACLGVFAKVAQSDKLKLFRESLRLFIHHFLLRNLKSDKIAEAQKELLETRAKIVEKLLVSKDVRLS